MTIDFDKEFNDFVVGSDIQDPITSIYSLLPELTDEQLKIYLQVMYIVNKYNLKAINVFMETFIDYKKKNKNMSFFNSMSFRKMLQSYSLEEQMRGIKIQNANSKIEEK